MNLAAWHILVAGILMLWSGPSRPSAGSMHLWGVHLYSTWGPWLCSAFAHVLQGGSNKAVVAHHHRTVLHHKVSSGCY